LPICSAIVVLNILNGPKKQKAKKNSKENGRKGETAHDLFKLRFGLEFLRKIFNLKIFYKLQRS
jgi:hypothetical protein